MTYSLEEKVKYFAVYSRFGIITLQFLANLIIPDHDAGVFQKPLNLNTTKTELDSFIESAFGGLTRWDAQYFLHIAQYGYTYENTLAFFPLFPLIVRHLSNFTLLFISEVLGAFLPIKGIISTHSSLILVSVLFNNIIFIKTSVVLYRLSLSVLNSEKLAYVSAILFCVNPASIFFSAGYSESLYCFLIFYGLLKIEQKTSLTNFIIIGLTGAVRSNGLINIGFLVYKFINLKWKTKLSFFHDLIFNLGISLSVLPFLTYQMYCYAKFCFPNKIKLPEFILAYGDSNNFVFPGSSPRWCKELIPFAYTYVQKHYWNVGFLNYYEVKQIPNFLLALPMIYTIVQGTWCYARHKWEVLVLKLPESSRRRELPLSAFPYVVHGFALTVFAIFMIHIQVTTRLLASSSPLPYWLSAVIVGECLKTPIQVNFPERGKKTQMERFRESEENSKSRWRTFLVSETLNWQAFFIKWYFLGYFFVGTLMFSNYLPWT